MVAKTDIEYMYTIRYSGPRIDRQVLGSGRARSR